MVIRMTIDWVFLDVGGIIFTDDSYFNGLFAAIAEAEPATTRADYDALLRALRAAQAEPFTPALLDALVPDPARHAAIRAAADASWADRGHHADELYPEALDTLRSLAGRYRLACITNHFSWVRDRAEEAGFADLIGAWAISAEVGAEKPDPALFRSLLRDAGTSADRVAMVGDRLDRDIAPAKALGMRTVWVLRNEAPDEPTVEQLAVPDAAVRALDEVPPVLERFSA
jgi:FMN phosphatase YigB (HAD superfamily)